MKPFTSIPLTSASQASQTSQPAPDPRAQGYPKLAETISRVPQFAIFRKFSELNYLNILRLQAELQTLEDELIELQTEDAASGDVERLDLAMDFQALRDSEKTTNPFRIEKMKEIAGVLKEYNAALLQIAAVENLPTPKRVQFGEYQKWLMKRQACGVNFPRDHENPYRDQFVHDHVAFLDTNPERDPITSLLEGPLVSIIHRIRGRPKVMPDSGLVNYSDRTIERASNAISAAVSSLLPTVCILVLHFVKSTIIRLVLTIVFTAVFSLALAFFTSGRKHEIFAATAAFAAVEVVFIGSTSGAP